MSFQGNTILKSNNMATIMSHNSVEQIKLPRTLINQLMTHAQSDDKKEVCGFIASRHGLPVKIYPIANIATPAEKLFEMEPRALIDAIKKMRQLDEEIFAIYHSHPSSPAAPSKRDIDEFSYPEALSLIISLNTKGVLEMRAYRMATDHASEVTIETV